MIDLYSLCVLYATSICVLLTDYVFPFFRCAVYYQPSFCSRSIISFIYHYLHYCFSFSCSIYASYTTQYQPYICIQLRHLRSNYYKYYNHYYVLSTSPDLFTLAPSSFASPPPLQLDLQTPSAAHPSSPPHHLHTSPSSSAAASTAFGILQADFGNSAMMVGG